MGYVEEQKKEAKKKGALATLAGVGTVSLAVLNAPFVIVAGGGAGTAYLTYKWFRYRAEKGMRF